MAPVIPLQYLTPGCTAQVVNLCGCVNQVQRLRELGIGEGARFSLLQAGCPCIIQLGNQQLCIRTTDDCQILVQPEGAVG